MEFLHVAVLPCSNGDGRLRLAVKGNLELAVEKVSEKMKPDWDPNVLKEPDVSGAENRTLQEERASPGACEN